MTPCSDQAIGHREEIVPHHHIMPLLANCIFDSGKVEPFDQSLHSPQCGVAIGEIDVEPGIRVEIPARDPAARIDRETVAKIGVAEFLGPEFVMGVVFQSHRHPERREPVRLFLYRLEAMAEMLHESAESALQFFDEAKPGLLLGREALVGAEYGYRPGLLLVRRELRP